MLHCLGNLQLEVMYDYMKQVKKKKLLDAEGRYLDPGWNQAETFQSSPCILQVVWRGRTWKKMNFQQGDSSRRGLFDFMPPKWLLWLISALGSGSGWGAGQMLGQVSWFNGQERDGRAFNVVTGWNPSLLRILQNDILTTRRPNLRIWWLEIQRFVSPWNSVNSQAIVLELERLRKISENIVQDAAKMQPWAELRSWKSSTSTPQTFNVN